MLDVAHSRLRTKRLLPLLAERKLDAVVCALPAHVYYFTAFLPRWVHEAAAVIFADGRSCLVRSARFDTPAAADEIVEYDADYMFTLRQEQSQEVAGKVIELLRLRRAARIGVDRSPVVAALRESFVGFVESIDSHLWQLRRRKDPDELDLMRHAIRCAAAMFRRATEIIEPGVLEPCVFGELHTAAVVEAGEPLSAQLGNDYACGGMGGPPRAGRRPTDGEMYIIDVGPAYRGYFADVTRSFPISRSLTDQQSAAWASIVSALRIVERLARPGVRCRDLYDAVESHFQQTHGMGMAHHLGHGVGLQPHEFPHLNPHWDDVLLEGEVIAVEPGLYSPLLGGGIRLENQYVVTKNGIENLLDYPLDPPVR